MQNTFRYDEGARKFGLFTATIFITILFAGLYGILHDQLTFSISPEYFTKFKFRQFGYDSVSIGNERGTVALIGFFATWWVGLIIGILIASTGMIYTNYENMRNAITVAIVVVFATAVFFSLIGYFWAKFHLINTGVDWWIPEDVADRDNFIVVGSIHNFSYLGGGIGLLFAIIVMIRNKAILVRQRNKFR